MTVFKQYKANDIPPAEWSKVWVAGPLVGNPDSKSFEQMFLWCDNHCLNSWTTHWYQDHMAFCFESQDEGVLFKMVWQ